MWLVDCGRQAPDQVHAAGLSWHRIAGQIVTHVHGDHTGGLEDFAFELLLFLRRLGCSGFVWFLNFSFHQGAISNCTCRLWYNAIIFCGYVQIAARPRGCGWYGVIWFGRALRTLNYKA